MYYDFLVKIPYESGKISKNRRGKTTYIEYTYGRKYIPEKKYNIPQRTTIGKMADSDESMMYPNPNYEKYFPENPLPKTRSSDFRSSCIKAGSFIVIKKIMDEYKLSEHLSSWDENGKGLFLDLAAYSIIAENNAAQHYPDYAYNHPVLTPHQKIYSDSTISRFLSEIDDDDRINFLDSWNEDRDHKDKLYISYDSTNKNCKAGDIEMAEYGHPKENVGAPIINYSIAFDMKNQEPLLYERYPGSIVDVSQLRYVIDKFKGYGYKNIGFILDRGYFSRENIAYMDSCKFDFVIMVKGRASFVHQMITAHKGEFEEKRSCAIREFQTYGMTIPSPLYADETKVRYFHLYHKVSRENAERAQLENTLDRMAEIMDKNKGNEVSFGKAYERYFNLIYHEKDGVRRFYGYTEREDVIENELRLCGYFAIVTSEKMSAKEALTLYKSRDVSEKLFCSDKSFLGNRTMRAATDSTVDAKIFVGFVALIVRARIYTLLRKRVMEMTKKPNFMTVPAALKELDKIELIRQAGGNYKLDHAITATQKTILGAFGIDESDMLVRIAALGKELMNAEKPEKETENDGTYEID